MIAWRETCAEREVSGQHSPRGRPFPRLSARLSACRGDSPAPVRPNTHRGTCPLVRGFRRAKTLTMQPVRLCVVFIGPRHSPCNLSACAVTSGQTNAHRPKNLSTYVVISSQTLTEEPVCLCGYIEPNTHRGTCPLVWLHRAKYSQRNLSACVVISSNTQTSRNLTLTRSHFLIVFLFLLSFCMVTLRQTYTKEPVHLYGYIGPNTHSTRMPPLSGFFFFFFFFNCRFVCLHRAKHTVQDI